MAISGVSSSLPSLAPVAAGIKTQIDASFLSDVLDSAGLLDPELAKALDSVELAGKQLAAGGVTVAKNELLGGLMDMLA